MADSYLIDGYNLIHALGMIRKVMDKGGLEASRTRLHEFLIQSFGENANRITVVFDAKGASPGGSRTQHYQGLTIRFAPKAQSADDLIETMIEESAEPRNLVVVSNDVRLQNAARHRAARAWSHEALLDFLDARQAMNPKKESESEKAGGLSAEEMKHWLKEFGHLEKDPELREFFDLDRFD